MALAAAGRVHLAGCIVGVGQPVAVVPDFSYAVFVVPGDGSSCAIDVVGPVAVVPVGPVVGGLVIVGI